MRCMEEEHRGGIGDGKMGIKQKIGRKEKITGRGTLVEEENKPTIR
jgi:hypothetical protein